MNKTVAIIVGVVVLGVLGYIIFSNSNTEIKSVTDNANAVSEQKQEVATDTTEKDSDNDGLPDNAEVLLGTDPQNPDTNGNGVNDKLDPDPINTVAPKADVTDPKVEKTPTPTPTPVVTQAPLNDFKITTVLVENNVNPATGKDASDHLEVFLKSSGSKDIAGFSLTYTITDLITKATQSYTVPLTGFVLKAGETKSVHIDTTGEAGHFRANPNSLYYQSQNEMRVDVTVSVAGHTTQTGTVLKDKGGAEEAD